MARKTRKNKSIKRTTAHKGDATPQFNKTGFISLSENKTLEWQLARWSNWNFFRHHLNWTRKQDHAGIDWEFEILGLTLTLNLHDNRHWDYEKDGWEK